MIVGTTPTRRRNKRKETAMPEEYNGRTLFTRQGLRAACLQAGYDINRESQYLAIALRSKIATGTLSVKERMRLFNNRLNRDLTLFCQCINESLDFLADGYFLFPSIPPVVCFLHRKLLEYRDSLK
jgi:hypothetical protein